MTEAPSRDTSATLPFASAARGVFDLSFEAMLWSRRSLFLALLLCLIIAPDRYREEFAGAEQPVS